ncbi:hypothetical protein [Nocardioides sp. URHA0020]|uniref:hypothetical protein n=1 Tax=Nocardioides sp. URHA0020 TaxID=1380392 RepID=UPI00048CD848|nr:hypothetical protein [Nocardioides sp. URHA0020]
MQPAAARYPEQRTPLAPGCRYLWTLAGLAKVRVGKTRVTARSWRWPADIVSWDSTQLRWIQVVDRSGLRSRWHRLRLR